MGEFIIECTRCAEGDEAHREDCLVSFLVDPPSVPIVFGDDEERALRALAEGGLLAVELPDAPDLRATGS